MDYMVHATDVDIQVYERGNQASEILFIILHGGPGSGAKPLMELSSFQTLEQEYYCIYFDQRGCGNSYYDVQQGLTMEQICNDVHEVLEDSRKRWTHKKIILWGGSFGGLLASMYMETYGNVDGLVLSSPAVTFQRSDALAFFQRTKKNMEKRMPIQSTSHENTACEPEKELSNPEFVNFVFSSMNPSHSLKHIVAMSAWFYQYNATNVFKRIHVPTLLMIGEDDDVCDATVIMNAVKSIQNPNIHAYCFKLCGHAVFEECKEKFVSYINSFIKTI